MLSRGGLSGGRLEGIPVYLWLVSLVEGASFVPSVKKGGFEGGAKYFPIRLVGIFFPNVVFIFTSGFVVNSVKSLQSLSWMSWGIV